MAQPQIFLSYRRDDTAGYARAVGDALGRVFGPERVFIDVDDIGAGQAFDHSITQAVQGARVLLVLIGPRWLAPQADGRPRLLAADDVVRQEVAAGLAQGLQVVPLLFDGAAMPGVAQLPDDLHPLARRQALVMDARRFAADTDRLVVALRPLLGDVAPENAPPTVVLPVAVLPNPARWRWPALGLAGLAVVGSLVWQWRTPPAQVPAPAVTPAAAPAAVRPAINGRWQADVVYDWPNAKFTETLVLDGEGSGLSGTATFLRVRYGILEGRVDGDGLHFVIRSREQGGSGPDREVTHRWRGTLVGDELRLVMQTEGATQPHAPVQIRARRSAP